MSRESALRLTLFKTFRELSQDVVDRLSALAVPAHYAAGDIIIEKGAQGDALYVLQSGQAHATVPDSDGIYFDDEMAVGEVFGEMSLLTGEVRSADITATTDCECLRFPFDALRAVIHEHPRVAQFLTTLVGKRLSRRDGIKRVGEYEIEAPLGGGGFATVFRARHTHTGEAVALKMLKHELVWRSDFARRFRREARIIQQLVHPNIVRVHGIVEAYATLFIVMELVEGSDLGQLVAARGKLAPAEVRFVARTLAAALHHAHERSVVHRDVKPANVLLTTDGVVKLVDFGIALGPEDGNRGTSFYGTPHYAAPEHVLNLPMDGRTDLYMLGITAYELLTGEVPYGADSVQTTLSRHVREEVPTLPETGEYPDDLREFIKTATRRRPAQRFPSCLAAREFIDAFGQPDMQPAAVDAAEWKGLALTETVSEPSPDLSDSTTGVRAAFARPTERAREVDLTVLELSPADILAEDPPPSE